MSKTCRAPLLIHKSHGTWGRNKLDVWNHRDFIIAITAGGAVVKHPPANAGRARDSGSILGQEDPLEKKMATHSSILSWKIPWPEEPGGLQSMGSQSRTWLSTHTHTTGWSSLSWLIQRVNLRCQKEHIREAQVVSGRPMYQRSWYVVISGMISWSQFSPLQV